MLLIHYTSVVIVAVINSMSICRRYVYITA